MIIEFHELAEEELAESACWYEQQSMGLGDDLLSEIDQWLSVIVASPDMWPVWEGAAEVDPPIRHAVLQRFPFAIAYQHFPDKVVVLAIAHASRRPFYWQDRK